MWFSLSAAQGDPTGRARGDALAKKLSSEQLEFAAEMVRTRTVAPAVDDTRAATPITIPR
jgi:hypothetical protein